MTDQPLTPQTPETTTQSTVTPLRVFKIGSVRVLEDDSTRDLTTDQVRSVLKPLYPEVAHATIREMNEGDTRLVEFLPQPGRKG